MKNIVIIGAGDLGKELVWLIEDINKMCPTYVILGFLDDDPEKVGKDYLGYRVLGTTQKLDELRKNTSFCAVIAIQDGAVRRTIVEAHRGFDHWETLIHPTAVIAPESALGEGTVLFPRVTVSVDTKIGKFDLLYINAIICNDCMVGDYVSVMTGAVVSEHAMLGDGIALKAGTCLRPHMTVSNCIDNGDGTPSPE